MTAEKKPTILGLKKELEDFKEDQRNNTDKILAVLEKVTQQTEENKFVSGEISEREEVRSVSDDGALPPQYQRIFEKYFDRDDGFTARLNFPEVDEKDNEMGGIMFTIVVPKKFSNASDAYLDFYKVDLRSRALQPGAVAKGIEDWCKRVSGNLKYNKILKSK